MKPVTLAGDKLYPSKIVCIGRNYAEHIRELGNESPTSPVIFIKPNSAIADEIYAHPQDLIHYEGEITFLIISGKLAAVGFGLDLTKREIQDGLKARGLPWERAKAFDNSAVFSEFVPLRGGCQQLTLELQINGERVQQGGYQLMLHKPEALLQEACSFLSFEDGDLLMTGTPSGVAAIKVGAKFVGRIFDGAQLLVERAWVVKSPL